MTPYLYDANLAWPAGEQAQRPQVAACGSSLVGTEPLRSGTAASISCPAAAAAEPRCCKEERQLSGLSSATIAVVCGLLSRLSSLWTPEVHTSGDGRHRDWFFPSRTNMFQMNICKFAVIAQHPACAHRSTLAVLRVIVSLPLLCIRHSLKTEWHAETRHGRHSRSQHATARSGAYVGKASCRAIDCSNTVVVSHLDEGLHPTLGHC